MQYLSLSRCIFGISCSLCGELYQLCTSQYTVYGLLAVSLISSLLTWAQFLRMARPKRFPAAPYRLNFRMMDSTVSYIQCVRNAVVSFLRVVLFEKHISYLCGDLFCLHDAPRKRISSH